jgi:UDP-N-acetylglucosamine 2-epimerase (non-hydrolysing)
LRLLDDLGLKSKEYITVTMHRPANVDTRDGLESILTILENASKHKSIVFPIHPRTLNNLTKLGLGERLNKIQNIKILEPQGYLEFLHLMEHSALIITDSGGIQEETTYLQIPCLTFRDSTERPVTVELGTNQLLADLNPDTVYEKMLQILRGQTREGIIPPFWDGKAAERIAAILMRVEY